MNEYSKLTPAVVGAYVRSRPALAELIDGTRIRSVREVGDGNLNLVFVVEDLEGRSIVLKQSLPHVRTDPTWAMTRERSAREAAVLAKHAAADSRHVARLFDYDELNFVLALEDLSDHTVWRSALNTGETHGFAVEALGRYVARVAFATSVFALGPREHRRLATASANPELCEITEELVFTEPYATHPHNSVLPANEPDLLSIQSDDELVVRVGIAKLRFTSTAQSLLHGDLHTGSVFVRPASTRGRASVRAFDSEFGFVGPTGFDLGVLWAHLVLAAARAEALGDSARARVLLDLPERLLDTFELEYRALWPTRTDARVWGDAARDHVLAGIRTDAAVFAGAECIRRIVGFAKASDIETLPPQLREQAARGVLRAGRTLVLGADMRSAADLALTTARVLRSAAYTALAA